MSQLNILAVQNAPILRALAADPLTAKAELATVVGKDRSNLNRSIAALAEAGLLRGPNDGERDLTHEGRAQLAAIDRAEGEAGEGKHGLSGDLPDDHVVAVHAQLMPDPDNARKDWDSDEAVADLTELAESIADQGLLQNPMVKVAADDFQIPGQPTTYMLDGGERRWRAIGRLIADGRWPPDRPILCRLIDTDDLGHRLAALAENMQRRNLNPLEKARAFEGLAEALAAQGVAPDKINRDIADRVGVTIEHVQQHRSFMKLDEADQARLALPKDDPKRLTVKDARAKVSAKDNAPEPIALTPTEWLALVEVFFAAYEMTRYGNLWNEVAVSPAARETAEGQRLMALNALTFSGIQHHGEHRGRFTVKRAYGITSGSDWCDPALPSDLYTDTEGRIAMLRHAQAVVLGENAPSWDDESPVLGTPWLADPGELTEEGAAIVEAARVEAEQREQAAQEREAALAARNATWAQARQRHLKLLAVAQERPEAGAPTEVTSIAQELDRPLPWQALPSGVIAAANGTIVKDRNYYNAPSELDLTLNQMIVVAANAAGGVLTPALAEPERDPDLSQDDFVREIAEVLQGGGMSEEDSAAQAEEILHEFLTDNGVAFGDEGFDWSAAGADTLGDAWAAENLEASDDADAADEEAEEAAMLERAGEHA